MLPENVFANKPNVSNPPIPKAQLDQQKKVRELSEEEIQLIIKERKPTTASMDEAEFLSSNYFQVDNPRGISNQQWVMGINKILEYEKNSMYPYVPNPEQYRSILSLARATLVDATAGSGKSTTMVLKAAAEKSLLGIEGRKMLAITYTRAAAESMEEKYRRFCRNYKILDDMRFSTIHALAKRYVSFIRSTSTILDNSKDGVSVVLKPDSSSSGSSCDDDDDDFVFDDMEDDDDISDNATVITVTSRSLIMKALETLNLKNKYLKHISNIERWIDVIIERTIKSQEELLELQEFVECPDVLFEDLDKINKLTKDFRKAYNIIAYSDMLTDFYDELKSLKTIDNLPFHLKELVELEVLYIDEFQDISPMQWDIILELLRLNPRCRLFCVGDADQAIYSFRGSSPEFLVEFEKIMVSIGIPLHEIDIIYFTVNRRCFPEAVALAKTFISKNKYRYEKDMMALGNKQGEIFFIEDESALISKGLILSDIEEKYVKDPRHLSDISILYREHSQSLPLVIELIKKRIPVNVSSGKLPMDTKIMGDVMGIISMILDSKNPYLVETYLYKLFDSITKTEAKNIAIKMRQTGEVFSKFLNTRRMPVEKELKEAKMLWSLINKSTMPNITNLLLSKYEKANSFMFKSGNSDIEMVKAYLLSYPEYTYNEFAVYHNETLKWVKENTKSLDGVAFKTMHAAKGLEFKSVYILPFGNNVSPKESVTSKMTNEKAREAFIEEERRLLFVAITRAMQKLTIFVSNKYDLFPNEIAMALNSINKNIVENASFLKDEKSSINW